MVLQVTDSRLRDIRRSRAPRTAHVLPPSRKHGTRGTYNAGCRCDLCTDAERDYSRARYHDRQSADAQQRKATNAYNRRRYAQLVTDAANAPALISRDDCPICCSRRDALGRLPIGVCGPDCLVILARKRA